MTQQDRPRFAELLVGIGETYGEPVSDARMEIYWRALEDLPFESVQRAAGVHVRTSKFFPKPVELREAIEGTTEDRAEVAWQAVVSLVRRHGYCANPSEIPWPDEQTKHAALRLYGSWSALCGATSMKKMRPASAATARIVVPGTRTSPAPMRWRRVKAPRRRPLRRSNSTKVPAASDRGT